MNSWNSEKFVYPKDSCLCDFLASIQQKSHVLTELHSELFPRSRILRPSLKSSILFFPRSNTVVFYWQHFVRTFDSSTRLKWKRITWVGRDYFPLVRERDSPLCVDRRFGDGFKTRRHAGRVPIDVRARWASSPVQKRYGKRHISFHTHTYTHTKQWVRQHQLSSLCA